MDIKEFTNILNTKLIEKFSKIKGIENKNIEISCRKAKFILDAIKEIAVDSIVEIGECNLPPLGKFYSNSSRGITIKFIGKTPRRKKRVIPSDSFEKIYNACNGSTRNLSSWLFSEGYCKKDLSESQYMKLYRSQWNNISKERYGKLILHTDIGICELYVKDFAEAYADVKCELPYSRKWLTFTKKALNLHFVCLYELYSLSRDYLYDKLVVIDDSNRNSYDWFMNKINIKHEN